MESRYQRHNPISPRWALKRVAAGILLPGLLGALPWLGSWMPNQDQRSSIRLSSRLVTLQVTVTDLNGRFIRGLQARHFSVYDDGVEQRIAFFSSEDAPVSLGIVYDTSGSMKGILQQSLKALRIFMDTCHQDDDFCLIGFNSRPALLGDFTRQADRIINSLVLARPRGRTALYDAVYLGIEKVRHGAHTKRALLIISDGQDNNSAYTYRQLRARVKESEVLIYAIGIIDRADDVRLQLHGLEVLAEITRMTGGRVFFPKTGQELINVCAYIAAELRRQYSLGYYPDNISHDRRRHKLKVKVHRPKGLPYLKVRTREGYVAY